MPTQTDMRSLPRWARVVFAARCARRVQPLFVRAWPDAPKEHEEALDRAITLAERSARVGRAERSAADAAAAARAADATDASAYASAYAAAYASADAAAAATARAAAVAARTADARAGYAAYAAGDARAAAARFGQRDLVIAAIAAEFRVLLAQTRKRQWTDDTPVDPDDLGPLWPDGEPKWARHHLAHRLRRNLCTRCGYSRAGIAEGAKCPECGS